MLGATPVPKITKSAGIVYPFVNSTSVTFPEEFFLIDFNPV